MILNNTVPIEEGETMYSYLLRMNYINGINIKDFLREYFPIKPIEQRMKYELDTELYKLTTPLKYSQQQLLNFVTKHSLFPVYSMSHKPEQIVKYINRAFRDFNESMKKENANHTVLMPNTTNFCPECVKESIEKTGFPVFYREHQVPGVKKCHKHNVVLRKYTGEYGKEYKQYKTHNEEFTIIDDEYETKYAAFTSYLVNAELDVSSVECETLIKKLLMKKPKGAEYLRDQCNYKFDNFDTIATALLFLFENVDKLNASVVNLKISPSAQSKHIPKIIHCPVCGSEYITSGYAIQMGWGCPNCDKHKTKEQIISKLIETTSKGQYRLKGLIDGPVVEIIHNNCLWDDTDAAFRLQYTDFLYNNKRCSCDTLKMKTWKEQYKAAEEYYSKHGNLLVSHFYISSTGLKLGVWIQTQRRRKRKGIISQKEIDKLEAIGMIWDALDEQFETLFRVAEDYYKAHGDLLVPKRFITSTGVRLGEWICTLRVRKKKGKLSQEVIDALESIGMVWDTLGKRFEIYFKAAEEYYRKHGNLLIPGDYVTEEGINLGKWIDTQRIQKKKGKLSQEVIDALESIGMVWTVYEERFEANYKLAEKYYRKHGNLLIPKDYVTEDGVKLGKWLSAQRVQRTRGRLSQGKIEDLESVGMVWAVYEERFEANYRLAEEYYRKHGNLLIPGDYVTEDGVKLGSWIRDQRSRKTKGIISQKKIEKLEAIGMIWNVRKYYFEENYRLAEEYYREHGNLIVPERYITATGVKLGLWIREQRNRKDKGIMAPEEIAKLEAIGMVWKIRNRHK